MDTDTLLIQLSQDIGEVKSDVKTVLSNLDDHNRRIKKLEGFKYLLLSPFLFLSFVWSLLPRRQS